jgi:ubiquinone biosynthesis protein UbiJ
MQLPAGFLHSLEWLLNRYLRLDPVALHRMAELDGRCIGMELQGIGLRFYIHPVQDGVRLAEQAEQVDTMLHGTPLAMAHLGLGNDNSKALFSGDVTITGDVETGQAFKAILDGMDVDWEEQLSRLTGDVIAHQAGNVLRHVRQVLQSSSITLQQDLGEYLKEELRVVPTRIEFENLLADVNYTRTATDRLEARIRRMQSSSGTLT